MENNAAVHEFSERLKQVLWSEEGVSILDLHRLGMWCFGACHPLAVALYRWLHSPDESRRTPDLAVLVDNDGPQHVVATLGEWCLDGNGACQEYELLYRWEDLVKGPPYLGVYDRDELVACGIPCAEIEVRAIVELLEKNFSGPAVRQALLEE